METRHGDNPASANRPAETHAGLAERVIRGSAWALLARVIAAASGLAGNALLARLLSPEDVGAYFLLVSIAAFAAMLARYGLKQTVVRLVAESIALGLPGRALASLKVVYVIASLGGLGVGGLLYVYGADWLATSLFNLPQISSVAGVLGIWVLILALQTPVAETFRGIHDIRAASLMDGALASALFAVGLAYFWIVDAPIALRGVTILTAFCAGISLLIGTILILNVTRRLGKQGTIRARQVLKIAGPIFVTNVATFGLANASLWIVGAFSDPREVAFYGAAARLVTVIIVPLSMVNLAVQPIIAELFAQRDGRRLEATLRGAATMGALPAQLVLATMLVFSRDLLGLVYGPQYAEASFILAALAIGHFVYVWAGPCGYVLLMTGYEKQHMVLTLITGTLTTGVAVVVAPVFGAEGVALVSALGLGTNSVAMLVLVRRLTGVWTHMDMRRATLRTGVERLKSLRASRGRAAQH